VNVKTCIFVAALLILLAGCAHHSLRSGDDGIHLFLRHPDATHVHAASSLDGYTLHEATRTGRGTWEIVLPAEKEFTYFFIVDGEVYVPQCAYKESDEYGSYNCVYIPGM